MTNVRSIHKTVRIHTIGDGWATLTGQITQQMQSMLGRSKSEIQISLNEIIEIFLQLALYIQNQAKLILSNALEVVHSGRFRVIQNSKSFKTGSPLELQFS